MKWLTALLSIYIFFLISIPCEDGKVSQLSNDTEQAATSHNHHDESNDGCSPFCFCSCCSISVVMMDFNYECAPEEIYVRQSNIDYISLISRYIPPVWQPPRIS